MNTHGQGGVFPKRGHTERNGSLTGRYMLLQGLNWSAFAVIWVYAVVLLRGSGLSYSQAGLVISLANILAVFAQQGLSAWADRAAVDSSAKAAVGLVSLGAAAALLFLLAGFGGKALAGVCFCLIGVAIIGVQPFLNAAAMERVQQGLALNYGLARGIGSVSYAAFFRLGRRDIRPLRRLRISGGLYIPEPGRAPGLGSLFPPGQGEPFPSGSRARS